MSAPDHHPYLTDADLRTPLDVALWLKERWLKSSANRDYSTWQEHQILEEVYDVLEQRLERERRQACRRGAMANWRKFSAIARWAKDRNAVPKDEMEDFVHLVLALSLAFRAAARQP